MAKPSSDAARRRERWRKAQEKAGLCQVSVWVPEKHREAFKTFAKALSKLRPNATTDRPKRRAPRFAFREAFPKEFEKASQKAAPKT